MITKQTVESVIYLLRECSEHEHCSDCSLANFCHLDSFETPVERAVNLMREMYAQISAGGGDPS